MTDVTATAPTDALAILPAHADLASLAARLPTVIASEVAAADFPEFVIESADEYAAVDAALTATVRRKDALEAERDRVIKPLTAIANTVRGWFKPALDALGRNETRLKGHMSAYTLDIARREREARAAAEAITIAGGDGGDLVVALTEATALAAGPGGRATTRLVWRVEKIAADMLPREWLVPDEKRIAAHARACTREEGPEPIPGVVFRRDAQIGARR